MTYYFQQYGHTLLAGGYLIVPIVPGQKRPALPNWTNTRLSVSDLAKFSRHGVGVLCGQGTAPVVAFDVDTTDPELARTFVAWCEKHIGSPLKRVGKAPKILLLYRAEHEGWCKSASAWFESPGGGQHRLEVLGKGQQFVAYHTHPDTGEPYQWTDTLGGASAVRAADLTVVSQAQVKEAIGKFEMLAESVLGFTKVAGSATWSGVVPASEGREDAWRFKLPVGLSTSRARELLYNIDNTNYDQWLRAGMALHHEFSGSDAGLDLWDEWSSSAANYIGRSDLEKRWARFGQGTTEPTTARWLLLAGKKGKEPGEGEDRCEKRGMELENAIRLVDLHQREAMYVPELKHWFVWKDSRWCLDISDLDMVNKAISTIGVMLQEAEMVEDTKERAKLIKMLKAIDSHSGFRNMINVARSDSRVRVSVADLDNDYNLLGVANGAVDLLSGNLIPPAPERRILLTTDTTYDPTATCPLFEETVSDAFFGDPEMVAFFQRLIGYSLMGNPKENIIAIPYGAGANGKSTILGAIQRVLGKHATSAAAETFLSRGKTFSSSGGGARADIVALRGSRFVYVSEPEEGSELREGLIKSMTGGEKLSARAPYGESNIEITPTWVTFMPTNHRPIIKGDDHGIWRRLLLIPFTRNFDKDNAVRKDVDRAQKLAKEDSGILAWCVRGALAYQQHGLRPPKVVLDARDAYREDMDFTAEWKEMDCEIGPEYADSSVNLWNSWKYYAEPRGLLKYVSSQRVFGRKLAAMGFDQVKNSHGVKGRGWKGIRVKRVEE